MGDKVFFDTNVLVYAFDAAETQKQPIARELLRTYASRGDMCLSTQVLQEFYVVTTGAKRQLLAPVLAAEVINDLAKYPLVTIKHRLIKQAIQRHQSKVFSFWDSLIVEAALTAGCKTLLSEDMQDGLQIDQRLTVQNPF